MKIKLLFCILLVIPLFCSAQTSSEDGYFKKKYVNIGFINGSLEQEGCPELKSNYGAMFSVGRTFYLHKKPIGKVLKFGIDATWFDLSYTNYKIQHITYWETEDKQYHQGEVSMHIGPSITINPIDKLSIHGYFRYSPSFFALYMDDFHYNYSTFFVGGASISYGVIGLGIESRFGECKYKDWSTYEEDDVSSNNNIKYNAWRAYLTFKF